MHNKAMRLPEIFGLSTFPVFRHCPTFDGQKSAENYTYFPGIKFRENVPEFSKIDGICRKSTVIFEIFDIRRYMSKIDSYFRDFRQFPVYSGIKWLKKWSKWL